MHKVTTDTPSASIRAKYLKVGEYALASDIAFANQVVIRTSTGMVSLQTGYWWSEYELIGMAVIPIASGTKITIEVKG
jgi:hypothetical protein